jgi:hypothetical protein
LGKENGIPYDLNEKINEFKAIADEKVLIINEYTT